MSTIKVLIAEDKPVYLDGLLLAVAKRPGISVAGTPASGDAALSEARVTRPDVLVIDVRIAGLHGLTVIRSLAAEALPTRALVVSDNLDPDVVYEAVSAGAGGYVSRSSDAATICDAIEEVAAGRTVWPDDVRAALAGEIRERGINGGVLSPREIEILKLVADGCSTPQIASRLHLSVATVKTHLHRSFGKLEVSDRAAAVAACIRRGLFD